LVGRIDTEAKIEIEDPNVEFFKSVEQNVVAQTQQRKSINQHEMDHQFRGAKTGIGKKSVQKTPQLPRKRHLPLDRVEKAPEFPRVSTMVVMEKLRKSEDFTLIAVQETANREKLLRHSVTYNRLLRLQEPPPKITRDGQVAPTRPSIETTYRAR
jgi:hypothetical protein